MSVAVKRNCRFHLKFTNWWFKNGGRRRKEGHFVPPDYSITSLETKIAPGTFKFFCLKINPLSSAGNHNFIMHIRAEGVRKSVAIRISVLDRMLPDHGKIKGIYYRSSLDKFDIEYRSPERLVSELEHIKSYRFNSISIYNTSTKNIEGLKKAIHTVGIMGPLVIHASTKYLNMDKLQEIENSFSDDRLYFMGVDEPNRLPKLYRHIAKSQKIHAGGQKVFTAIKIETEKKLRHKKELLDWANFNVRKHSAEDFSSNVRYRGQIRTYYWQCYMETPGLNRLYSGFFLYNSRLDGIFPYVFQHNFPGNSPYESDINGRSTAKGRGGRQGLVRKNMISSYPLQSGFISTIQWEAFLQGDEDLKYCTLLETHLKELEKQGELRESAKIRKEFKQKISSITQAYDPNQLISYMRYENRLNRDLESLRDWIINILNNKRGVLGN